MTTKTLTKQVKLADEHPPREIRLDTKARRAWCEAKAAEINARPERKARVVGIGSYQHVSVWRVIETEGRIQRRGTCQVCGGRYALEPDTVVVLHGYKRPRWGYIVGQCPGVHAKPAECSIEITERILANKDAELAMLAAKIAETEQQQSALFQQRLDVSHDSPEWEPLYNQTRELEKKLRDLKGVEWQNTQYVKHLRENVVPKLGTPITERVVA